LHYQTAELFSRRRFDSKLYRMFVFFGLTPHLQKEHEERYCLVNHLRTHTVTHDLICRKSDLIIEMCYQLASSVFHILSW